MLQYFRINDPYRLLGLLAIFLLINLPHFIDTPDLTFPELKSFLVGEKVHEGNALYTELVDSVGPLSAWFDAFLQICFGRSILARHLVAFIIIFLQASYIGIIFSNQKAFAEATYIPALIYAIAISFSFDTLSLTPELLAAGALLPALNNLFKEIEFREQRHETVFNIGLYISLASLFAFSYSVYIIGAIITLAVFTRTTVRKYILLSVGFALPHLLLIAVYYLKDGLSDLWQFYYQPNFIVSSTRYISNGSLWILLMLPLVFLVISLFLMNREARLSKYQTQLVQSMFFWMIFSFVEVWYSKDFRPQNFIPLIPAFSFFITHCILILPRKKFAEISIWVLLLGTVLINYLARYNAIDGVNYKGLFVPAAEAPYSGKRLLVLDESLSIYRNNRLASPFLNWQLAKGVFSHPEYYDNIIRVYEGIKADPPEVIRDKNDLLKPFMDRLPELKKLYTRKGTYYILNTASK
ncbi:MAG: hypothetical protein ABI477_09545 [Chryseolinea sp.]